MIDIITVGIINNELIFQCDAGDASITLRALNKYNHTQFKSGCYDCIKFDLEDLDAINKDTVYIRDSGVKINVHKSLSEYVNSRNTTIEVIKPVIRVGITNSRIFSNKCNIPDNEIDDMTKYFLKAAINCDSFKKGTWDGYVHLYDKKKRTFKTGLLSRVLAVLDKNNVEYDLKYLYDAAPQRQFNWEPIKLFEPSEDQIEAVNAVLEAKRCVIKAATGFGKTSMIARYVTAAYGVPTLFIANKKVLLDDAANDFISGIDGLDKNDVKTIKDGWFGDYKLSACEKVGDLDAKIVVATIQSLAARLKDKKTSLQLKKWLSDTCKCVIVDETQAVGTEQWDNVLNHVKAPYRMFMSATPHRSDGATLKIYAYAGRLAYETTADEQIRKGRLCEMDIQYWPFDHKLYNENDKSVEYAEAYRTFIVENENRNKFIIERILEYNDEERQTLVLVQSIDHGHLLKDMLLQHFSVDEVAFVWGDTPDKKRMEVIANARKGILKVLIGSTVADAGLNIPSIGGVVLCGCGQSDIVHVQRIGRGSRNFDYQKEWGITPKFIRENNMKKVTRVMDIIDNNVIFFKKQAKERYYNACEEFNKDRVHIVGADTSIFRYRSQKKENISDVDSEQKLQEMFEVFKDAPVISRERKYKDKNVDAFISAFNAFNGGD